MKIKTIIYHLTPVRMVIIKKSTNNRCWRGCKKKGTLLHCSWECKLIQPLRRTVWRFLKKKKLGIKLLYDPLIPTTGHMPWENHNSKRHMYSNVHCSSIYNSQDMEATYMSINRWIHKEVVVYICIYIHTYIVYTAHIYIGMYIIVYTVYMYI